MCDLDKVAYLACFLYADILAAAPADDAVCRNVWVCQRGSDWNVTYEGQTFFVNYLLLLRYAETAAAQQYADIGKRKS